MQLAYEPLSAEDRMFLACERPNVHMHVAATLVFDAGSRTGRAGPDVERVLRFVESRLALVPRYRQRLRFAALAREPVWVDDDRFDIAYHVRHVVAPQPGDDAALKRIAGHIISRPLDRSRPLWQLWVVTGLSGDRFAVVAKLHHCMVDGIASADLLVALLAPQPSSTFDAAAPFVPRPAPSRWHLLRRAVERRLRLPLTVAEEAGRLVTHPSAAVEWIERGLGLWESLAAGLRGSPDSPINRPIGPHRRFDWTTLDLDAVQAVRGRLGGSINDVALATVAGALHRFILERHPDARLADLRVLVPVNMRGRDDRHDLGNRVSGWLVTLPVCDADPLRRYAAVRRATEALKASRQHLGGQILTSAGSALLGAGLRLVEQIAPFNLLVTNVPGPREPLYLLNARLRHVYPAAPLFPRQGLALALFSHAGTLCVGIHADCHVVPDTERLVGAIDASFNELWAAAGEPADQSAPRRASAG